MNTGEKSCQDMLLTSPWTRLGVAKCGVLFGFVGRDGKIIKKMKLLLDFWSTISYNIITVKESPDEYGGRCQKGEKMEEQMTDYQFQTILKMILEVLDNCKDIEEAKEKIKALLNK